MDASLPMAWWSNKGLSATETLTKHCHGISSIAFPLSMALGWQNTSWRPSGSPIKAAAVTQQARGMTATDCPPSVPTLESISSKKRHSSPGRRWQDHAADPSGLLVSRTPPCPLQAARWGQPAVGCSPALSQSFPPHGLQGPVQLHTVCTPCDASFL